MKNLMLSIMVVATCNLFNSAIAQEHPEHPSEKNAAKQSLTIEEFADAAEKYIRKKTEENGGSFKVEDEETGKVLELKMDKVHRERLSYLGENTYFVCADFKAEDDIVYDIDIFMTGTSKDDLEEAQKPMVHKVNGEPRFSWYEEDGIWKRDKAGESKEKKEHPEHPDN